MSQNKIEELLVSVFGDESEEAAKGKAFMDLKCWDSLHYVQWVVGVQATFRIELTPDQILRITSLSGLKKVLKEHGLEA